MSKWFAERRMEWIVETVRIFGFINREHIERKFDVSTPQASKDLADTIDLWPELMAYNKSAKRYELLEERQ